MKMNEENENSLSNYDLKKWDYVYEYWKDDSVFYLFINERIGSLFV
jgi:hypothetical protein